VILDSRHLLTVAAIAETGSLTAAARRLHLTLSAVSHQLREIESLFGTALFDRGFLDYLAPHGISYAVEELA
jgi:LysR family transcriptional regulator for metE and metH